MIESQKEEICRAQAEERRRQDHQLLHEQLLEQNRDLCEAHEKSLSEMEELKRFQGSTFDTITRGRLIEDRDTILELLKECEAVPKECRAAKMGRQAFGTHMVHRETFFQIQQRLLQHLIRRS